MDGTFEVSEQIHDGYSCESQESESAQRRGSSDSLPQVQHFQTSNNNSSECANRQIHLFLCDRVPGPKIMEHVRTIWTQLKQKDTFVPCDSI